MISSISVVTSPVYETDPERLARTRAPYLPFSSLLSVSGDPQKAVSSNIAWFPRNVRGISIRRPTRQDAGFNPAVGESERVPVVSPQRRKRSQHPDPARLMGVRVETACHVDRPTSSESSHRFEVPLMRSPERLSIRHVVETPVFGFAAGGSAHMSAQS